MVSEEREAHIPFVVPRTDVVRFVLRRTGVTLAPENGGKRKRA